MRKALVFMILALAVVAVSLPAQKLELYY